MTTQLQSLKSLRAPIGVGAVIFLVTVIVSIPASAISLFASHSGALSYAGAEGTIWDGELHSASASGVPLGDVTFRLAPLSLLRFSPEVTLSANGAVRGSGTFSVAGGGRVSVRDVKADINLAAVAVRGLLGEPARGEARLEIERLEFSPEDGCLQAAGSLWTNALDAPTKRYNLPALPLSGAIACVGDQLEVTLAGENVRMAADVRLHLNRTLAYEVTATARASEENIASALRVFGFEDDNGALTYGSVGILTGVGS